MSLGTNISYLRKQKKITQEQFAEKMNVTRQTVSRWESDEITPELSKLVDMSELFACKLDALVKEELSVQKEIYSSIQIKRISAFKMASYVMISPNPESDVIGYMERWAANSGLKSAVSQVKCIGWDFPFVSQEQQNRFGMHGYVAACIIPEGFETDYPGVQYSENMEADYAVLRPVGFTMFYLVGITLIVVGHVIEIDVHRLTKLGNGHFLPSLSCHYLQTGNTLIINHMTLCHDWHGYHTCHP